MKVKLQYVNSPEEECAVLNVYENHPGIIKLKEIIEKGNYQTMAIPCFLGEQRYSISCEHILYFETIQELLFVHTGSKIYEAKKRLYELEEMLPKQFVRVSKSVIMNLKQVEYYSPLANGLMKATFYNGEETYISRKYLRLLRASIGGVNL
ncbi:LytTR family DNA-binding domain-containing protein [Candidatus Clostridium stratigraminis]|uniref:LytTR family DNA-binding domain-containing protein n=1 Tax=Candidatus Clostridium stratigraminis TaxID=3381661 RepID=A0ABW8T6I7_9CLOT